ncbi:MAG TPA: response regulator [Gemmatimonadales bacterium]|nr:response regulator [Gemmatimonadales bacterium]
MTVALRLLLIEDSEDDAFLLTRELERGGYSLQTARVDSAAELTAALDRQPWDLVIGDYSMPQFSGLAGLNIIRQRGLDMPFIFVSGTIGEETAVAAMRAGANDYVMKGQWKRLLPAIARELRDVEERRGRRHAEAALRESEASYAILVEHAPLGIYRSNTKGRFLSVNSALVRMLGYGSASELLALDMNTDLYVDAAQRQALLDRDNYTSREYDEVEATWKRKDGAPITVQLSVRAIRNAANEVEYYETFVRDVTEQRQLEAQLVRAQKLEAVGRLAGGVAHDFNNLLTVILSYSSLLIEDNEIPPHALESVQEIKKAADGAAGLTKQLLAFSRQQVLQPQVLDVNSVVQSTQKLLNRLIGEDVKLITNFAPDLGVARLDPGQLGQIIMNLAVNARDAMPTGGILTIETANVEMDLTYVRGHPVAQAGHYVMLAVSDTGIGMDEATKERIFEPFFTTKETGKGTGLGLATVYGIVKQSGGFIWVYSEPGRGTSFKIYFPRIADGPVAEGLEAPAPTPTPRGTETVLVVEDVSAVRGVAREMLERSGYRVIEAANGDQALRVAAKHSGPIDLLLTDVVMPGISGRVLAQQLAELRPQMRVLYMSGYTDDAVVNHGMLEPGIHYLQKPFTRDGLARKVHEVLRGPRT